MLYVYKNVFLRELGLTSSIFSFLNFLSSFYRNLLTNKNVYFMLNSFLEVLNMNVFKRQMLYKVTTCLLKVHSLTSTLKVNQNQSLKKITTALSTDMNTI